MLYILNCIAYLLTGCMDQSPSWETNRFSTSKEIPPILWKPNFHYSIHECLQPVPILSPYQWINPGLRHQFIIHNMLCFYGEELFATHPSPKLEYHCLSAVSNCLFNIFAATLHIEDCSSIHNLSTCNALVQIPTYLGYIPYYDGFIVTNDSEDVLSVCIINTTSFFLLDMFHL